MSTIHIGKRAVGDGCPLYFIADVGANHDGSLARALHLIELAAESGADAVKFQNFKAATIVSDRTFRSLGGQLGHQATWNKSVLETYADASISSEWTPRLKDKCKQVGVDYFTSPYDFNSVDLVDPFVDVYKIGSGDVTWPEIQRYIASKGKPILLAAGAAAMNDVYRAVATLLDSRATFALLQCNTNYTTDRAKIRHVNLNVLKTFAQAFPNTVLGLSDHTFGHATVCGATALGARIFEKHFTDDNERDGPDHKFAMTPSSWRHMVTTANEVYASLGDGTKRVEPNEVQSRVVQQRSLHATRDLPAGTVLAKDHFTSLRPCPVGAFPPYRLPELVGAVLLRPLEHGECLTAQHLGTVVHVAEGIAQ